MAFLSKSSRHLPLLHHLQRSTEDGSAQVGLLLPEAALEAVGPAADPGGGGDEGALVLLVGDNLSKLVLDVDGVHRLATDTGKGIGSLFDTAALDEVTGGVGQEEETTTKDQSPGELNGDRDAVLASVTTVLGSVADNGGKHDTEGDTELVTSDESTTDLAGALNRTG